MTQSQSARPAPVRLFKYMKADHLNMTLRRGRFRIGTLLEFRKVEQFGTQIGDAGEGTKTIHLTASEPMTFDLRSDDPRAVHARKVIKGWDQFHPASRIIIAMQQNSSVTLNEESQDVYTYCASMNYDASQMHTMGYEACLVISDAQGFFSELSNSLQNADFIIAAEVQYRDRRVNYSATGVAPAAFIKPQSYAAQCEFRAIWQPKTQPIGPVIVECPRALLYCAKL